ncbi:MAG: serine O-acetyltransferase [Verrucomicrobiae bacterium]|nr:serine O-acetyltransferase [Verrucomicrobiae bacterium]
MGTSDTFFREILRSYRQHGGINHLDGKNLPSRDTIAEITQDLLAVIFPGFHSKTGLFSEQTPDCVKQLLGAIARRLQHEIKKSLAFSSHATPIIRHPGIKAAEITPFFLSRLPKVRRLLVSDIQAAYEGDPAATSHEEIILAYPGLEAIAVQRLAHILYQERVPLIPRIMTEWAHSRTGIDIHPGARIGPFFFIDHGTGVVIGETTLIGSHVKIYQGVSLGAKSFAKDARGRIVKGIKRHPNVGNHVTIYANATILGGDTTIGDNTTVAANVFLTQSAPPHSLVCNEGAELRIIPKKKQAADKTQKGLRL